MSARLRPHRLRLGPALLTPAALALACTSAPQLGPPAAGIEIPGTWSVAESQPAGGAPVDDIWWTTFGDTRLERLVAEALERNHDLRAAAAAVVAAAAQARIAGADLKPQADFGLDGSKSQQVFVGLPIPNAPEVLQSRSSSWGARFNVSWEADLWGRLRAGQAAARADAGAAEADYAAARLSLAARTAKTWFSLAEAGRQVRLSEYTVASRRRTAERIAARYRRGLAPALELRLARSDLAQAESVLERRRLQADAAARQLETLLGRYPSAELEAASDLPPVPPRVLAGLPAELVTRRPDLQAAERRLAATGWRVSEARRALYPGLRFSGTGGTSSSDVRDLVDGDFTVWSLAGGLLQPIFQGGRLRAAVEFAQASREQALAAYATAVLDAFSEVESALAGERILAAEEQALTAAVAESEAAAELAEDRYHRGVGDYLSLLESQRQAYVVRSLLLTARRNRLDNRADLHLALGGDLAGFPPAASNLERDL